MCINSAFLLSRWHEEIGEKRRIIISVSLHGSLLQEVAFFLSIYLCAWDMQAFLHKDTQQCRPIIIMTIIIMIIVSLSWSLFFKYTEGKNAMFWLTWLDGWIVDGNEMWWRSGWFLWYGRARQEGRHLSRFHIKCTCICFHSSLLNTPCQPICIFNYPQQIGFNGLVFSFFFCLCQQWKRSTKLK